MKPSDEARLSILKALSHHKNSDMKPFNDVFNALVKEYQDRNWINEILISMDINHAGLINMEFQSDAQGSLLPLIPAGAIHFLTPDGEFELANKIN